MVVTIEACPINSLIFTTSTPASASRVPNVWRKSWNLKSVILASRHAAEKDFLISVYRVPVSELVKTYSASPARYYLRHPNEVEEYLARREQKAEEVRQRIEGQQGDLSEIRARLLTQRGA